MPVNPIHVGRKASGVREFARTLVVRDALDASPPSGCFDFVEIASSSEQSASVGGVRKAPCDAIERTAFQVCPYLLTNPGSLHEELTSGRGDLRSRNLRAFVPARLAHTTVCVPGNFDSREILAEIFKAEWNPGLRITKGVLKTESYELTRRMIEHQAEVLSRLFYPENEAAKHMAEQQLRPALVNLKPSARNQRRGDPKAQAYRRAWFPSLVDAASVRSIVSPAFSGAATSSASHEEL